MLLCSAPEEAKVAELEKKDDAKSIVPVPKPTDTRHKTSFFPFGCSVFSRCLKGHTVQDSHATLQSLLG